MCQPLSSNILIIRCAASDENNSVLGNKTRNSPKTLGLAALFSLHCCFQGLKEVSFFHFCMLGRKKMDTSAGTGKLCILGHLRLVFIWSCFVSCLLFLLFYVSLRNLCYGTCRKIPKNDLLRRGIEPGSTASKAAMLTTIPPTRGWLTLHFSVTFMRQRTTLFSGQLALQINYKQTLSAGS